MSEQKGRYLRPEYKGLGFRGLGFRVEGLVLIRTAITSAMIATTANGKLIRAFVTPGPALARQLILVSPFLGA